MDGTNFVNCAPAELSKIAAEVARLAPMPLAEGQAADAPTSLPQTVQAATVRRAGWLHVLLANLDEGLRRWKAGAMEAYLARATDIVDLEHRIRYWEGQERGSPIGYVRHGG